MKIQGFRQTCAGQTDGHTQSDSLSSWQSQKFTYRFLVDFWKKSGNSCKTIIWKWTRTWFICLSWWQLRPGVGKRGIINKRAMTIMHEVTGASPVQALTYLLLLQPPRWLGNERIYQWGVFMGSRCMVSPGGDMSHVRPVYPLSHDNAPLCVLRHIIQPLYCFIKQYVL